MLLAVIRRRRLIAFALYCWLAGELFFTLSLQQDDLFKVPG